MQLIEVCEGDFSNEDIYYERYVYKYWVIEALIDKNTAK